MEKQNNLKYEYIPDVSHIMGQAGYRMNLMEILAEPMLVKSEKNSFHKAELNFVPENFFYLKGDING